MPLKHFQTLTDSETNDNLNIAIDMHTFIMCVRCMWVGDFFSNAYCCHIFFSKKNLHGLFPKAFAPLDRLFQRKCTCLWGNSYFPSSILHFPRVHKKCGITEKKMTALVSYIKQSNFDISKAYYT